LPVALESCDCDCCCGCGVLAWEIGCGVKRDGAERASLVAFIDGAGVVIRDGIGADTGAVLVEMETMNCSPFVIGIEER